MLWVCGTTEHLLRPTPVRCRFLQNTRTTTSLLAVHLIWTSKPVAVKSVLIVFNKTLQY